MSNIFIVLLSIFPALIISSLLAGIYGYLYERITGEILGVGAFALLYPIIISALVYMFAFSLILTDLKKKALGQSVSLKNSLFIFLIITFVVSLVFLYILWG